MNEHTRRILPHIKTLLEAATRSIVISNPENTLELFNNDDVITEIARVARRGPRAKIQILLRHFEPVRLEGSRFIGMLKRIPTRAQLRVLSEHPEARAETMVITDGRAGVTVPNRTRRPMHLVDKREVKSCLLRFDTLWNVAEPPADLRQFF